MVKKHENSETIELSSSDVEAVRVPMPSVKGARRRKGDDRPFVEEPLPRKIIDGRYKVVRSLGSGAMGSVYLVKHVRLKKLFALKTVNPILAGVTEYASRFEREADACSRLSHPNCISVTDFGKAKDGSLYLVMEYADGTPLDEAVDEAPLSISEAVDYTRQILLGLKHAHKEGLVHRDIKLGNLVRCRSDDGRPVIKILDFGMAKDRPQESVDPQITRDGSLLGTPQYMAPEQIRNSGVDARTDLFAVGMTMFRMLAGKPIYDTKNPIDIFSARLHNPAPSLKEVTGVDFPEAVESFIAKALERNKENRFSSAEDMLEALEAMAASIPGLEAYAPPRAGALPFAGWGLKPLGRIRESFLKVAFSFGALLKSIIDDAADWYACREQNSPASWISRIKGLGSTTAGRAVLVRLAAVLVVFAVLTVSYFAPDGKETGGEGAVSLFVDEEVAVAQEASKKSEPASTAPPRSAAMPDKEESEAALLDDPVLMETALLIEKRQCRGAEKRLRASADQESAEVLYLRGRIQTCLGQHEKALSQYAQAVSKDPVYKADARILENVKAMVSMGKLRSRALDFMANGLGEAALPALIHMAGHYSDREARQQARALAEKLGAMEHVDLESSYEMDLNQGRTCTDKREAVEKLAELGTQRARQALVRARDAEVKEGWFKKRKRHECVQRDILGALARTRSAE